MRLLRKSLHIEALIAFALLLLPSAGFAQHYNQTNLASDQVAEGSNPADVLLVNAWGLARSATSPWWLTDNGKGVSTIYNGATGVKSALVVTVPGISGAQSSPTGVVANGTGDFLLPGTPPAPAKFIFVTEDGTIAAWNTGTTAITKVTTKNAVYKGVTIGEWNGKHYLYAANFHSGKVEVYDTSFSAVRLSDDAFQLRGDDDDKDRDGDRDRDRDPDGDRDRDRDRDRDGHYAPFNVQAIGGNIFVTFAKQMLPDKHDEVDGAGIGFVEVFDPAGHFVARLQHGSWLDAPWGVAMAPGEFGEFSHALLVGNFGSGRIAAYNPLNGKFLGLLENPDSSVLTIDGLWALGFGNDSSAGPYNTLFFTAGPDSESHGLFGKLLPVAAELTEIDEP